MTRQVLESGDIHNIDARNREAEFDPGADEVEDLPGYHTAAVLCVPLSVSQVSSVSAIDAETKRWNVFPGVVTVRQGTSGAVFSPRDQELLATLAGVFSYALNLLKQKNVAWAIFSDNF